jgi:hypothetical protein
MVFVVIAALALLFPGAQEQQSSSPVIYDSADAYQIYSVLLPHEESWRIATGTLVIQQETVPSEVQDGCFTAEARKKFKDAIADYRVANGKRRLLQPRFEIEKPYLLVTEENIRALMPRYDWQGFYNQYPGSGGVFTVSAVGFNKDRTLAVVYTRSQCGLICGESSAHLLEKTNGKWKEVGVGCGEMS